MKNITIYLLFLPFLIKAQGNQFSDFFMLAKNKQDSSQFQEAIGLYKMALSINPDCSKCYEEIGNCYLVEEGKNNKYFASLYYYYALSSEKGDRNNISRLLSRIQFNNIYLALKIADSLVLADNCSEYLLKRAAIFTDLSKFENAINDYKRALEINEDLRINSYIGYCYMEKGEYFNAIQYYNVFIDKLMNWTKEKQDMFNVDEIFLSRGDCKFELHDYYGALEDYKKSLVNISRFNKNFNLPRIHNSLAKSNYFLKNYPEAIKEVRLAIQFNKFKYNSKGNNLTYHTQEFEKKELAISYYFLGCIEHDFKRIKNACKLWSISGELGIKHAYELINENCN